MKPLMSLLLLVLSILNSHAQLAGVEHFVINAQGESKSLRSYLDTDEGNVTLFVFWKTCCPTNISMIESLFELKEESENAEKIKIVLVSVDDSRTSSRVLPVVKMKGWNDDVIMDTNMELARAMQVNIPPQWVAVDHTGNPIFRRKIMEGESDAEYYFNELITEINKK